MANDKPKDLNEYREWLRDHHKVEVSDRTRARYETVAAKLREDYSRCQYWRDSEQAWADLDAEYRLRDNSPLFMSADPPPVVTKTWSSFFDKTFRLNVAWNRRFPNPPTGGWVLPPNWFSQVEDVVRASAVVKYLDGVVFLGEKLSDLATSHSLQPTFKYLARPQGYYAAHLLTRHTFEVPTENWETQAIEVTVEMQVTTQLQEVIRKLLHRYYEEARGKARSEETPWQWRYASDEFTANYLGHILHYVEGMIMDVRRRQAA